MKTFHKITMAAALALGLAATPFALDQDSEPGTTDAVCDTCCPETGSTCIDQWDQGFPNYYHLGDSGRCGTQIDQG